MPKTPLWLPGMVLPWTLQVLFKLFKKKQFYSTDFMLKNFIQPNKYELEEKYLEQLF